MSVRFEVTVNKRRVCIAGIRGNGVVTIGVDRVQRSTQHYPKNYHRKPGGCSIEEWCRERVSLHVGGARWHDDGDENYGWHLQDMKPGDEIRIRVLPSGKATRPKQKVNRRTKGN